MSTETLSNKDQAHELLKERVEGKGVQAFLQLARKLDGAVQSGLVEADSTKSSAAPSWEDAVIAVLDRSDWSLIGLMDQIGLLLDEAQQYRPAEFIEC